MLRKAASHLECGLLIEDKLLKRIVSHTDTVDFEANGVEYQQSVRTRNGITVEETHKFVQEFTLSKLNNSKLVLSLNLAREDDRFHWRRTDAMLTYENNDMDVRLMVNQIYDINVIQRYMKDKTENEQKETLKSYKTPTIVLGVTSGLFLIVIVVLGMLIIKKSQTKVRYNKE
eukprot:GAHX01001210.1.p1 GENE.GAHX01001210.1~~GAHX01001210.1.p1  ORF type:complete len:173 (-),score=16.72 GAHX01001210.1:25-543(-)